MIVYIYVVLLLLLFAFKDLHGYDLCSNMKDLLQASDKSAYLKIIFLISHSKHMLWVLKRTVSMRRFFRAPKTHV